jgi:hypothetical protein
VAAEVPDRVMGGRGERNATQFPSTQRIAISNNTSSVYICHAPISLPVECLMSQDVMESKRLWGSAGGTEGHCRQTCFGL